MPMEFVRVEGLDGLVKRLKAFPVEMAKNGGPVRAALAKGAKVIRDEAKANVQRIIAEPNKWGRDNLSTGALVANIVSTRSHRPKAINPLATEIYRVRIKRNAKRYADTRFNRRKQKVGKVYYNEISYYGRFLEFGTEKLKPYAWLRNAAASKQGEALRVITTELARGIARIEKKMASLK